jgi:hypothetical protein
VDGSATTHLPLEKECTLNAGDVLVVLGPSRES